MNEVQIVWLRRDLRLTDQAALAAAARAGPVVPVYVLDDKAAGRHAYGGASRWWLHHSLADLASELARRGSRLILRRGDAVEQLRRLAQELGGARVHAIRHYEPWWRKAQGRLKEHLELALHDGNFLFPPGALLSGSGAPYRIFTPFKKALFERLGEGVALTPEPALAPPPQWPASDELAAWNLLPARPDWAAGFRAAWRPGAAHALARFDRFGKAIGRYREDREKPSLDGTSRLSASLHFGEVSPRQLWHALAGGRGSGPDFFRAELAWRDYAQNLICQFPDYAIKPHRQGYGADFWRDPQDDAEAAADLAAWQEGRTGYPIVDAGMRQLWHTGWMHNRVRMIAASFLVKHLLIDWRHGEKWFWDTLVDADYASNATNWQWVSGTGVDSSMFVRIMAPLSQSEKFAAGDYIRHWVPELARVEDPFVHDPPAFLRRGYPPARIGHKEARERALAAYRAMKARQQD